MQELAGQLTCASVPIALFNLLKQVKPSESDTLNKQSRHIAVHSDGLDCCENILLQMYANYLEMVVENGSAKEETPRSQQSVSVRIWRG